MMNMEKMGVGADPLITGVLAAGGGAGTLGIKRTWQPLRLTYTKPSFTNQDAMLAARPDLWHKFIIYGIRNYEKTDILDACMAACDRDVLLPILYVLENSDKATFLARCKVSLLENLVKQGLRIKMADGHTLGLDIVLGFVDSHELQREALRINPPRAINQALQLRYETTKKILNLEDFQNDKNLHHIYCLLSCPQVFHFVMRCCGNVAERLTGKTSDAKLSIRELNLRSNGITSLVPLNKYLNFHLTKVDLSKNLISDVKHLRYLTDFTITELWLDGNPLCSRYSTVEDYVREVKTVFPHIQKLDGVIIGTKTKFVPIVQMNYLGDWSRIKLVKQFVRHFFTYYDQDDRNVLSGIYDHDSLFSMTLGSITNSTHHQLTKAFANNRNLLKFVDYAKCQEFLLRGPEKIIATLRRQPPTYHDYKRFNIDILHYGHDRIMMAIQGHFSYKEYPYAPLFFNRTFVIMRGDDNEYCIVNDQYHIQSEMLNTGDETKLGPMLVPNIKPTIFSPTEKEQLLSFLIERTTMNEEYCRIYLEKTNWDIRAALGAFMKAYTVNDVPPEAFQGFYSR